MPWARVAFALLLVAPLVAAPTDAQVRGRAGGAAPAASSRGAPAMPPALVTQLIDLGKQHVPVPEISHRTGRIGYTILVVTSNRQVIARESATAADTGAAYTPSADTRRDEVRVTCVDTTPRRPADCDRVVVLDGNERQIPPLRSGNRVFTFTDDRGAAWEVRGAENFYLAAALKGGFVATGVSRTGNMWTLVVTADDARTQLLLGSSLTGR